MSEGKLKNCGTIHIVVGIKRARHFLRKYRVPTIRLLFGTKRFLRYAQTRVQRKSSLSPFHSPHPPARDADQRLLHEPARHQHGVEAIRLGCERVRG